MPSPSHRQLNAALRWKLLCALAQSCVAYSSPQGHTCIATVLIWNTACCEVRRWCQWPLRETNLSQVEVKVSFTAQRQIAVVYWCPMCPLYQCFTPSFLLLSLLCVFVYACNNSLLWRLISGHGWTILWRGVRLPSTSSSLSFMEASSGKKRSL